MFECLFQGNPTSSAGLLYGRDGWKTYVNLPEQKIIRKNYTDTADMGSDYLCSIDYDLGLDGLAYVVDILYTNESMEVTEPLTAGRLLKNKVKVSDIESNNGGRGFARNVASICNPNAGIILCQINWFHQSQNKESRIITNSASVKQRIVFPDDWHIRWPEFYNHVTNFKKKFSANQTDDPEDTLTGIIERMNLDNYVDYNNIEVDYSDL